MSDRTSATIRTLEMSNQSRYLTGFVSGIAAHSNAVRLIDLILKKRSDD